MAEEQLTPNNISDKNSYFEIFYLKIIISVTFGMFTEIVLVEYLKNPRSYDLVSANTQISGALSKYPQPSWVWEMIRNASLININSLYPLYTILIIFLFLLYRPISKNLENQITKRISIFDFNLYFLSLIVVYLINIWHHYQYSNLLDLLYPPTSLQMHKVVFYSLLLIVLIYFSMKNSYVKGKTIINERFDWLLKEYGEEELTTDIKDDKLNRSSIVQKTIKEIQLSESEQKSVRMLLHGDYGSGKTSVIFFLLNEWVNTAQQKNKNLRDFLYFDVTKFSKNYNFSQRLELEFRKSLVARCRDISNKILLSVKNLEGFYESNNFWVKNLMSYCFSKISTSLLSDIIKEEGLHTIIIIDNMDRIDDQKYSGEVLRIIREKLVVPSTYVILAHDIQKLLNILPNNINYLFLQRYFNFFEDIVNSPDSLMSNFIEACDLACNHALSDEIEKLKVNGSFSKLESVFKATITDPRFANTLIKHVKKSYNKDKMCIINLILISIVQLSDKKFYNSIANNRFLFTKSIPKESLTTEYKNFRNSSNMLVVDPKALKAVEYLYVDERMLKKKINNSISPSNKKMIEKEFFDNYFSSTIITKK